MDGNEVHRTEWGATRLSGRATSAAVERALAAVPGVSRTRVAPQGRTVQIALRLQAGADPQSARDAVASALHHGFWIDLGLADVGYELTLE